MAKRLAHLSVVAVVLAATTVSANPGGDAANGAALYKQCVSCHQIGEGATNRVGPQLNLIFDRAAASEDGFRYSKAFQDAAADGLVWTHETLDTFLADPRGMVRGTRMSFRGIADQQDRDDLIAYLRAFSDDPQNIPESAPTGVAVDHAVAPEILAIVGDPAYGEYLSGECTSCHQANGSTAGVPSITQWPTDDFVTAMHAYKDKARENPVMQMMAGRLSNEEIAALAAYFESVE